MNFEQSEYSEQNPMNLLPFLAGQILLDASLREHFLQHPQEVAHELGLHLTESQIENIMTLDPGQIEAWVEGFEGYAGQPIMAMSAW